MKGLCKTGINKAKKEENTIKKNKKGTSIYLRKTLTNEEKEKRLAEDIWLDYFNRYLFECWTISEKDYKKMTEKIAATNAKLMGTAATR